MANRDKNKPFWERNKGYGIFLSEYKGNYALQAGKRAEADDYVDWVFMSEWSKAKGGFVPGDKKRPMGVYLGPGEDAIKALEFFLGELKAKSGPVADIPEDDIPF